MLCDRCDGANADDGDDEDDENGSVDPERKRWSWPFRDFIFLASACEVEWRA